MLTNSRLGILSTHLQLPSKKNPPDWLSVEGSASNTADQTNLFLDPIAGALDSFRHTEGQVRVSSGSVAWLLCYARLRRSICANKL